MCFRSFFLSLLALVIRLGAAEPAQPTPPPGWQLDLVAQAPAIQHPGAIATAPDGRVFVAEDPMDITTERPDVTEGRIVCFHPDGRRTVFVDRIGAAFGLQYLEGKLYVLHNPYLSTWEDRGDHGTNRVDLVRNTNPNWHALGWNDHIPANFRLGLDGRFYVATGDKGLFGAVGSDGKRFDFFGGGIFRVRPDGSELESYSTGVRNILDVVLDADDQAFTFDNTDEHEWMGRITHMVDGGYYGYPHEFIPRRPHTLWCFADIGAGAATGMACALDDALPKAWRGHLFLADFGKRNVFRVPLARVGATFAVAGTNGPVVGVAGLGDVVPLFTDPPEDFRPVGLAFSADGRSLWIGDWQHRDVKNAQAVAGRLWRLTWNGPERSTPFPEWYVPATLGRPYQATDQQLMAGLGHPSKEVRLCAQRRLEERLGASDSLAAALRQVAMEPGATEARMHALWALAKNPESTANLVRLIADADPRVAAQAMRWAGESRVESALPALLGQLKSDSAERRFRAATALGRLSRPETVVDLQSVLADPDSWVRYAAFTALNRVGRTSPAAWNSVVRGLASPNPQVAEASAFALRATYDPALVPALQAFLDDSSLSPAVRASAAQLLAQMCRQPPAWDGGWWAYHPFRLPPPRHTVEWSATPEIRTTLIQLLRDPVPAVRRAAVNGLQEETQPQTLAALREAAQRETDSATLAELVRDLGRRRDRASAPFLVSLLAKPSDPEVLAATLEAGGQVGSPEVSAALVAWLTRNPASKEWNRGVQAAAQLRLEAAVPVLLAAARQGNREVVPALGQIGGDAARQGLLELLRSGDLPMRRAVLPALATLTGTPAVTELLAAWQDPELRAEALLALSRSPRSEALEAYLTGLASKNLEQRTAARKALETLRGEVRPGLEARAGELTPEVITELQGIYQNDAAALAGPLFRVRNAALTPEAFLEFALAHPGDPTRGETLFRDANGLNCLACHRLRGEGADVGPDLSNMGAQFSARELAESILWPSRVVREGYQPVIVELTDDEEVAGLIKGESTEVLTLRDSAGKLRQVPKSQIRGRRQSEQSLMPEGLQAGLSLADFADLIAFASRCRQAP